MRARPRRRSVTAPPLLEEAFREPSGSKHLTAGSSSPPLLLQANTIRRLPINTVATGTAQIDSSNRPGSGSGDQPETVRTNT